MSQIYLIWLRIDKRGHHVRQVAMWKSDNFVRQHDIVQARSKGHLIGCNEGRVGVQIPGI